MTRQMARFLLSASTAIFARLLGSAGVTAVLSIGLALATSAPAWADVIYSYTGNTFTSFSGGGPYTIADYVTVSLTLSSALGANLSASSVIPQLVSLSMSDGVQTLTDSNPFPNTTATFTTDSGGTITGWNVEIQTAPSTLIETLNMPSPFTPQDAGETGPTSFGQRFNAPGTWTLVPEPGTVTLLVTGLAGLFVMGAVRRRNRLRREEPGREFRVGVVEPLMIMFPRCDPAELRRSFSLVDSFAYCGAASAHAPEDFPMHARRSFLSWTVCFVFAFAAHVGTANADSDRMVITAPPVTFDNSIPDGGPKEPSLTFTGGPATAPTPDLVGAINAGASVVLLIAPTSEPPDPTEPPVVISGPNGSLTVSDVVISTLNLPATLGIAPFISLVSDGGPMQAIAPLLNTGMASIVEDGNLQPINKELLPTGGNQLGVTFVEVQSDVVPEPGTLLLLGSGLAGLAAVGARRRRV